MLTWATNFDHKMAKFQFVSDIQLPEGLKNGKTNAKQRKPSNLIQLEQNILQHLVGVTLG
mgnify:CR=1 FL=1